jgi:hypothetical protein
MTPEERRKVELALNKIAIELHKRHILREFQPQLGEAIDELGLDAEIVFCGEPTPEYLQAIRRAIL